MKPDDTEKVDGKSDLLTIEQAAKLLHVHSNTLRRWSNSGKLKAVRINSRGDRRFRLQDIQQYLLFIAKLK